MKVLEPHRKQENRQDLVETVSFERKKQRNKLTTEEELAATHQCPLPVTREVKARGEGQLNSGFQTNMNNIAKPHWGKKVKRAQPKQAVKLSHSR